MNNRELLVPIYIKGSQYSVCRCDRETFQAVSDYDESGSGLCTDAADFASSCENHGADALLIFDLSQNDAEHDRSISLIKKISRATDLPLYGGGNIRRMEDVKKLIYAGCRKVFLNYAKEANVELTAEASARFGKERMLACVKTMDELQAAEAHSDQISGAVVLDSALAENLQATGFFACKETFSAEQPHLNDADDFWCVYAALEQYAIPSASGMLSENGFSGIFSSAFTHPEFDFMEAKHELLSRGIPVNTYEASLSWADVRPDGNGLLPVVVQDYRTLDVLMVAYMNEEAYNLTIRTGRMTYFSRSRQEIWVKGLTSGHYQYVRELAIDCDNDTLLAKVVQIGAACHTGNRSCFYRTILKKEYDETNPMKVFEDVFAVIEDRKIHPKEGSYTNYLFDKGIDKILKKVGEEATEIVIAAKNPDAEEVVYEISDFLYHVMVLMAEKGLTWQDITEELAKR
ncbi:MAG: bifunctional phosphoribosyl-AMP cyclohydrolase/phosphoribosyl-ATP diphosphatase HisIE [Lachnospiraceae bacterium]|nr:bifunctional phosphoribosyl-AMP cyclohydrolase/phosphoribosyl-ATP diphosphatase HisIE [Lachnospiraceae bacterium]